MKRQFICEQCGKSLINITDEKTGKIIKYLRTYDCTCFSKEGGKDDRDDN